MQTGATAKEPPAIAKKASSQQEGTQPPASQTQTRRRAAAPKQKPAKQAPAQQQTATAGLRNRDSGSLVGKVGKGKGNAGRPAAGGDATQGGFDAAAWEAENAALIAAADAAMESD